MSNLSPEAQALVRAARDALRPGDADRERVLQTLLPRIGGEVVPHGVDAAASGATKALLLKVSGVIAGVALSGGVLFLALRQPPPAEKPVGSVPASPAAPSLAPAEPPPESATLAAPAVQGPAERRAPAPSRSADNLAKEVAILSRASAELRAGQPAAALAALDEHQRAFPGGVLAQERSAARIQALCALGRTRQARSELARLERASPRSPHVARAKKACGLPSSAER